MQRGAEGEDRNDDIAMKYKGLGVEQGREGKEMNV
jgi:hypothetical protein